MAPAGLALIIFFLLPILYSIRLSLYEVRLLDRTWAGWKNYVALAQQGHFWTSVRVSAKFFIIYVFCSLVVAYLLAIGFNRLDLRLCGAMLIYYRIPCFISVISSIAVWRWFYRYDDGAFNSILASLRIKPILWLGRPSLAPWAIGFAMMGGLVGGSVILYSAALAQINPELLEAARLDGANELQIIWHIITPLTHPMRLYILLGNLIGATQVWEHPFFFTQGGPLGGTRTMMYEIFHLAFEKGQIGLASALTTITALGTLIIAIFFLKQLKVQLG